MRRLPLKYAILLVVGFWGTLPFVLGVIGDLWWISVPLIMAWTAVLWIWGLPLAAGTPDAKTWTNTEKGVGTLIMLGQSLVGGVLAVFFVMFFITAWLPTILAILLLAVGAFWFGREPPKPELGPLAARARKPRDLPDPQPDRNNHVLQQPPATLSDWFLHHLSLVLVIGFGGLTAFDCLQRHSIGLGWPAVAMTLAYAMFLWIHVISPLRPGESPQPVWEKVLETLVGVVMTIVLLAFLAVLVEAIGKFWVWVVPPVGLLTLVIAMTLRSALPKERSAEQAIVGGARSRHGQIVN